MGIFKIADEKIKIIFKKVIKNLSGQISSWVPTILPLNNNLNSKSYMARETMKI